MTRVISLALLAAALVGCMSLWRAGPIEGTPAPPTLGRDAEGRSLALSAMQGNVVLLTFWHGA